MFFEPRRDVSDRTLMERIKGAVRYHGRFGYESFFLVLAPVLLVLTGLALWWLFGEELHPRR